MVKKHFMGDKYTDEVIKERAAKQGFTVVSINRDQTIPYVYLECINGHKKESSATSIQSTTCLFCEGKRMTLEDVGNRLNEEEYTLLEMPNETVDAYGNPFVAKGTRFKVQCSEGHVASLNMSEFNHGRKCATCAGTIANAGYSRSEEIIAKVFDYVGIPYERQVSTGDEFENLYLDFYLPTLGLVIEYDGAHHKYGRSTSSDEQLEDIKRKDRIRDLYADHIGFTMIRIDENEGGKSLVYKLADILKDHTYIDVNDPYYDSIVADVFNDCAERFGWLTYMDIRRNAKIRMQYTQAEIKEKFGYSTTMLNRHFKWVYGMTKQAYFKFTE